MSSYYEKLLATGEVKCIDEEIPFEIPQGWEWCRLGVISNIIAGYAFPSQTLKGEVGCRVIRISDITENGFDNSRLVRYSGAPISESYSIKQGDILMAMTGGTVGKSLYVTYLLEPMLLNQRVVIIRSLLINSDYLDLVIKSPYIHSIINDRKNSTNDNISMVDIWNFLIPVPPLTQQSKIVEKYNNLLLLVEKYSQAQYLVEELNSNIKGKIRKSILQEAIHGRLVPQIAEEGTAEKLLEKIRKEKQKLVKEGKLKKSALTDSVIYKGDDNKYYEQIGKQCKDITEEIPFEISPSWQWVRLSCVADIYTGNSISEAEKKVKFTNVYGRYYIGTKDVGFDNIISYNNGVAIPMQYEHNFKIAPNHSILMCIEGGSAGRKIAILNQDVCFGNKLCCFSPFIKIGKFIYYYLQSQSFIDMFNANKTGIIGGVSIAKVKEILIPIPPLQELQRIVAQIERLFEQLK
ncbi:MAG: restriction endonuclease subunit S [Agathobacter sp.]